MDNKTYNFKKLLSELKTKHGRGTELISLYIPMNKQIHEVVSKLRDEYSQSSNIKSRVTRQNVQSALESLISRLKYIRLGENGIVIFCGAVDIGANKTDLQTYIVEPLESIYYKYHCDSTFYITPLEDMVLTKNVYGLVVLDLRECTIGILRGNHVDVKESLQSLVPNKHKKGGQSQHRFQQLRDIAINEFYTKAGKNISDIFVGLPIQGIFIGGHSPAKEELVKGDYLHYTLKDKVLGLIDTGYTDEYGLGELVSKLNKQLTELSTIKEKTYMCRFFEKLATEEKAIYGREIVYTHLTEGSVSTLLISENVDSKLVNELVDIADTKNTEVVIISNDFIEGEQLAKTFGGIAAILRYNV